MLPSAANVLLDQLCCEVLVLRANGFNDTPMLSTDCLAASAGPLKLLSNSSNQIGVAVRGEECFLVIMSVIHEAMKAAIQAMDFLKFTGSHYFVKKLLLPLQSGQF